MFSTSTLFQANVELRQKARTLIGYDPSFSPFIPWVLTMAKVVMPSCVGAAAGEHQHVATHWYRQIYKIPMKPRQTNAVEHPVLDVILEVIV